MRPPRWEHDEMKDAGPPAVFRTTDRDHELHVQNRDLVPWCEQCQNLSRPEDDQSGRDAKRP